MRRDSVFAPWWVGLSALLGLAGCLWVPLALWPGRGLPAWPSATLALLALALARYPGRLLYRATATIAAAAACTAYCAQVALLGGMAWILSR